MQIHQQQQPKQTNPIDPIDDYLDSDSRKIDPDPFAEFETIDAQTREKNAREGRMWRRVFYVGLFVAGSVLAIALAGCGEKVPTDIVDQNQIISRNNAVLNARAYTRAMGYEGVTISADSDSTISPNCRYGDGWATVKLVKDGIQFSKLKCQTNGQGKGNNGCLTEKDFSTKEYASQDGKCDSTLSALPKLDK